MSDYQKVAEFNLAFDFPQFNDFSNKTVLDLRLALIEEELGELKEAYANKDLIEEQDACADILYVAYGMAWTYKINSDEYLSKYKLDPALTLFQNINKNFSVIRDKFEILNMLNITFSNLQNASLNNNDEWCNILHKLIVLVYEFQVVSKYDSDKVFTIVHDSNMSKLCTSEAEAKLTVEKYQKDFESGKSPYDTPYYYPLNNGLYVVKNKSTGKALKSINYRQVKLT
jgi:predicted HAD superfamily Cof-like phosphohydrolase